MKIQILGAHNCESENSRLLSLLIDDVLAIDAGGLTSSLSFPAQQKLRAILLTHHHYDHVRDIPTVAMNFALNEETINIYSTQPAYEALCQHLLDGKLYPNFMQWPENKPAIKFNIIEPYQAEPIGGYSILAIPVKHTYLTVGYQITSSDGNAIFYTSDTGPGLADCWQYVSPQLLIAEVTAPNKYEEFAIESGHLTPSLLKQELIYFREVKDYLPQVILVHMNPIEEKEIETEIALIAETLNIPITLAYEGMQLHI